MAKKLREDWPEVVSSTPETKFAIFRAARKGILRKIANRLYTTNLTDPPESIVRRHLWPIVGSYVPGALIADRTALENAPASDGSIYVIAERTRPIILPGITIKPRKGSPPLESDREFIGNLRLSSIARAFLENMVVSRPRAGQVGRTLTRAELEERLDGIARRGGAAALNKLRDEARAIAPLLGLEVSFTQLDKLIGAMLGTREATLETAPARARRAGRAYDPARQPLFEKLHAELRESPPVTRPAPRRTADQLAVLAFYESYFSNFIEGTEFPVEDAAGIVFQGRIPAHRPEDAHDILGTYRLASDPLDSRKTPRSGEDLHTLLKSRHAVIMVGRADKNPGLYKDKINQAGSTVFVHPDLVEGTLEQGYRIYQNLDDAFARAVFMMFLVSEVHPFADGNGRTARIMMNAELTADGEERIIIPTVYRNNYLSALRALSLNAHPRPLVRMLDFAQKWTAAIPWQDVESTQRVLQSCNALLDPVEADERGLSLRLP